MLPIQIEALANLVAVGIPAEPTPDVEKLREAQREYIAYLIASHRTVELRGVRADQPVQVDLEKLYVNLRVRPVGRGHAQQEIASEKVVQDCRKVVVLGGPGAGKSTLLRRLILDFAPDGTSRFELDDVETPILLRLAEIAKGISVLPDEDRVHIGPQHIFKAIERQIQGSLIDLPSEFFKAALEDGKCLLLFDALDEVPGHRDREEIVVAIKAFMTRFPQNRYLITTRPYAYRDRVALSGEVYVGHLDEFSTADVQLFLDAWYDSVKANLSSPLDRRQVEDYRSDLKRAATSNPNIAALTRNPLLLTNIAIIHYNQRQLPERRAELYDLCTDLMFGF